MGGHRDGGLLRFLSTPSARRATVPASSSLIAYTYFYPRPPRGGRLARSRASLAPCIISIHALREEGDSVWDVLMPYITISIHALREEGDCRLQRHADDLQISIHALREEGDGLDHCDDRHPRNFYPRPPRGGRPYLGNCLAEFTKFLSTPSARRATHTAAGTASHRRNFYPRPPRGGRHLRHPRADGALRISIHALREEGDSKNRDKISIFL